jgi:peptidoglycan hydrolase-like protein with peptidoglycan-binding domain
MSDGADGEYGAKTEVAVKGFQTANSLEATGIVEQTTYDKLFSDTAVAAVKTDAAPAENAAAAEVKTDAQAPAVAQTSNEAPAKTAATPNTQVEKTTSELSSKSVSAITDSPIFKRSANATNFEFILWLAVMIVVMLVAFAIVYAVEKKKQKAAYRARRFQ